MGEAAAKALAINPDLIFAQAMYQAGNLETYSYLGEIEAFERAVREQPNNPWALSALSFDLMEAGYVLEAVAVAERLVNLEPLSLATNVRLFETLYAAGRTSEAMAAMEVIEQLDSDGANAASARLNVVEKRYDVAVARWEADLQRLGYDSSWVRELVIGASDPANGQAYLDRRIPQIVASTPEDKAIFLRQGLKYWYLYFGFLDRYFDIILDLDLTDSAWTDADVLVFDGIKFRRLGFTAHPRYLEVTKLLGHIDLWEQRGPPDFCEKVGGEWVCE